jgi:hypothetical protein
VFYPSFKSSGFTPAKALLLLIKSTAFVGQKQCFSNALSIAMVLRPIERTQLSLF